MSHVALLSARSLPDDELGQKQCMWPRRRAAVQCRETRKTVLDQRSRDEQCDKIGCRLIADDIAGKVEHRYLTCHPFELALIGLRLPAARPVQIEDEVIHAIPARLRHKPTLV